MIPEVAIVLHQGSGIQHDIRAEPRTGVDDSSRQDLGAWPKLGPPRDDGCWMHNRHRREAAAHGKLEQPLPPSIGADRPECHGELRCRVGGGDLKGHVVAPEHLDTAISREEALRQAGVKNGHLDQLTRRGECVEEHPGVAPTAEEDEVELLHVY